MDALPHDAERRQVHRAQPVDGREGNADAEVRPRELHRHILREGRGVTQLDADFRWFADARRIGFHGDLAFGVGGIGEGVQRHRRTVKLAEAADQAAFPSGALCVGLHVHDGHVIARQRHARRRLHRQADDAARSGCDIIQHPRRQRELPALHVRDQSQRDGHGFLEGIAHGERQRVRHAGHQRLVDVDVALAALRLVAVHK